MSDATAVQRKLLGVVGVGYAEAAGGARHELHQAHRAGVRAGARFVGGFGGDDGVDEVRFDADFCRDLVDLCAQVALAFAEGAADVDVEFVADFRGEALGFDDVALRAVFGRLQVEDAAVFAGDGTAAAALGVQVVKVVR